MNKFITRIVALVLISCLAVDPVAVAFARSDLWRTRSVVAWPTAAAPSQPGFDAFSEQAISAVLLSSRNLIPFLKNNKTLPFWPRMLPDSWKDLAANVGQKFVWGNVIYHSIFLSLNSLFLLRVVWVDRLMSCPSLSPVVWRFLQGAGLLRWLYDLGWLVICSCIGLRMNLRPVRLFPAPVYAIDHPFLWFNGGQNVSYLNRHRMQWRSLSQIAFPAIIRRAKSREKENGGLEIQILALGASTGEELARAFHESVNALQAHYENPEQWRITVDGVEGDKTTAEEGRERLQGQSPFVWWAYKKEKKEAKRYAEDVIRTVINTAPQENLPG